MEKRYDPKKTEEQIYSMWERGGYFTPRIPSRQTFKKKKPFVITLPPPNVTGGLHAGHAMYVIEDIMIRYHRMKGDPTLWLPGFDHASIAVEYLVAKQIAKEGKTKKQVGRAEFLKRAQKFANDSRKYIREQLKKTGFSLDWTREAYTMDKIRAQAVQEAFRRLYKKGLIYQGKYLVNWCPKCQTAISDLENEHQEEKGKLYYVKYGPITIATTRPETMFADIAVAIHPQNKKYQKLVGLSVPLPLTDRKIPIIEDEAVDPEFGTGALKITPAHDQLDYEIGQRHQLKTLKGINPKGKLTEVAGKYAGLHIKKAQERVVNDLKRGGFIEKIEDYTHSVGHCQRCDTTTEPTISKQWFVKTKPLAKKAIQVVKNGQIKIVPKKFEKTYFHWLENIKDWCISRQLWWGHKIPFKGESDILDTWFSSALWPISVFNWPKTTKDFDYFYVNRDISVRETGYDILFFWVTREIMMCLEMTEKTPFDVVYLHGLVRDEKGRKFSKTAGIGFNPLEIIEKHGADPLRMALVAGNSPGRDLKISEEKVIGYRNFTNKVWNIGRFILTNLESRENPNPHRVSTVHTPGVPRIPFYSPEMDSKLAKKDKDILKDLNLLIKQVTHHLEKYRFDLAADGLYHFIWHRFADKYIEYSKSRIKENDVVVLVVLRYVYLNCLKLLHPFMPFVTEEIWSRFPRKYKDPLIISRWPET